jgi:hypothetical protein
MRVFAARLIAVLLALSPAAFGQIVYDNKVTIANPNQLGIVTDPGAGAGGFDASVLVNTGTPPDTIFGFGHGTGNRLAENFTVPAGFNWTISGAHVFGYTTGATVPGTTAGVARILDGSPAIPASVTLAGDTTTNRLQAGSNVFMNIYRTLPTDIATATNRRIQDNILNFAAPVVLGPGTYWFEYGLTGNAFVPPLQVVPRINGVNTGDALQFSPTTLLYSPVLDGTTPKGIPFQLIGTSAPIPEPASLGLLALGVVGLCRRGRKD